ncbi:MAG: DUF87 domain-containing protein [Anaerolineae bacterium]|nr:DUF87 domain-containing protein [Anaerolineae bacterium]
MSDERSKSFFLGRLFDAQQNKQSDTSFLYDPDDLTTHAVITGMTGSGKTGLGVDLLEEAALKGIPAIIIDPKGDLTNLLLHFPDLLPADFEPWVNPDAARSSGSTLAALAESTAKSWSEGLKGWGLGRQDLLNLKDSVEFNLFTPGSNSANPVNLLASFEKPDLSWEDYREPLRERVASSVTALLTLIGLKDIDPLRSREHILISNLLETAWSKDTSLTLVDIIMQIQKPPFERLGAFPVEQFFPEKDRFELAFLLNNFLASPSFQTWQEGQSISDIQAFLYDSSGKARHSIFYLAHLSEAERMFFVTLLFASLESWMRTQRGTNSLRALMYFDEIVGYLPPVENPPSRTILLRMLKQARAFGLGLVLATQNPVDVDYKALSNAGTWFIGRLQTEQDRNRLLDGLMSASGNVDRGDIERMISGLPKRTFLVNNVHVSGPKVFQTRWTLNYLAGPMTRSQLKPLLGLIRKDVPQPAAAPATTAPSVAAAASQKQSAVSPAAAGPSAGVYSTQPPAIPGGVEQIFIPNHVGISDAAAALNLSGELESLGIVYHPALYVQARLRYFQRTYNLNYEQSLAVMLTDVNNPHPRWENYAWQAYEAKKLQTAPLPQARFDSLPAALSDARTLKALRSDFEDWLYQSAVIKVKANLTLKVYAAPDVTPAAFRTLCSEAAQRAYAEEQEKVESAYERKVDALARKIDRQKMEVAEQKTEVDQRKMEQLGAGGELVLSLFSKRRKSISSSLSKMRLTEQAKADLEQEQRELQDLEKEYNKLMQAKTDDINKIKDRWADIVNDASEVSVTAARKDILVERFGVAWTPYYLFRCPDGQVKEAPACAAE